MNYILIVSTYSCDNSMPLSYILWKLLHNSTTGYTSIQGTMKLLVRIYMKYDLHMTNIHSYNTVRQWVSYQIHKIVGCASATATDFKGNRWSLDPGMHHGMCVKHVPWCMSGSLTRGGGEKWPRHSRCMHNPQFYVSGKWLIYKPSIINRHDLNMFFLRRYGFGWFISSRTMIYFNNVSWFKISFSGNNNSIRGPFILVYQPMAASRHSYTEFIRLPARYGTLP